MRRKEQGKRVNNVIKNKSTPSPIWTKVPLKHLTRLFEVKGARKAGRKERKKFQKRTSFGVELMRSFDLNRLAREELRSFAWWGREGNEREINVLDGDFWGRIAGAGNTLEDRGSIIGVLLNSNVLSDWLSLGRYGGRLPYPFFRM